MKPDLEYFNNADQYELDYSERTEDIDFYINICKKYFHKKYSETKILELGCGSGRISLPLANLGFKVTGIDLSSALLKRGQQNAKKQKLNIKFIEADFRKFNLKHKFDLIIIPFNTLQHAYTLKQLDATFKSIKKHLNSNGVFAFDINNITKSGLKRKPYEAWLQDVFKAYYDEKGILRRYNKDSKKSIKKAELIDIVVEDTMHYNAKTKTVKYTLYYSMPQKQDFFKTCVFHRIFNKSEVVKTLVNNKIKIENIYGDFISGIYKNSSTSQVYICKL